MKNPVERLYSYFSRDLWIDNQAPRRGLQALLIDVLRIVTVIIRDIVSGDITLRAAGLVYTTLLSLVPLLAVSFSVLKAFGVHNAAEPFLINLLAPLGPTAADLANRIVGFVNNIKVGVLGFVGMGLLIYTVISLIQKVEESFNAIWRLRSRRGILQRFSDYLSVILVGPVLIVSALGITASLMSTTLMQKLAAVSAVGVVISAIGKLIPYVLVCVAFLFIYIFMPNTRVRLGPALFGAVTGGVLWETVGWGFGSFIVASTRYGAIYSGFAVLILFMMWLYVSWLILLVGAEAAFYRQNPQYLTILPPDGREPNTGMTEQTAVSVMFLIARNFYLNERPWTTQALAQRLGTSQERIEDITETLKRERLIAPTAEDPATLLPARDIGKITLSDIYSAVRGSTRDWNRQPSAVPEAVRDIVTAVDQVIDSSLHGTTLRDLVGAPQGDTPKDARHDRSQFPAARK
ncbi:MAG TPA: YhjD/YihY/BrkB family envelope integrity protein [Nitrospirota bacterium]|nr:YhjD/YihY/BrkB family envelope integrity protein [Nitrospirota bacterium]